MKILKNLYFKSSQIGLIIISSAMMIMACHSSNGQLEKEADGGADKEAVAQSDKEGFKQIFDGKTLNGWEGKPDYWKVENGNLVGEETSVTSPLLKANTFLIWKDGQPADFEFKAEFKISENGNSGVQYRSEKVPDVPFALKGYQVDIDGKATYTGQNYEERKRTTLAYRGQKVTIPEMTGTMESHLARNAWTSAVVTGSLGSTDSLKSSIKDNDWNEVHIIAKGNHLQHYINGVLMSDVTDDDTVNRKSSGLLGLQLHAGMVMKVEYRNIRLKNL